MIKLKREKLLLKPKDIQPSSPKFEVMGVLNPAAIRMKNQKIILYARVIEKLKKRKNNRIGYSPRFAGRNICNLKIDKLNLENLEEESTLDFLFKDGTKRLTFISHLRKIVLDESGFKVLSIDKKPSFCGCDWDGQFGVEDPRIVKVKDLYIMAYVSLSKSANISSSLAVSSDCKKWWRKGIIFREQNKDVVIFPERVKGRYVALNRPEGNFQFSPPHIWISYSKNLEYWGKPKPLILSKKGWDSGRVGAGPPPIKTDKGWLLLYHAVTERKKGHYEGVNISLAQKVEDLFGFKGGEDEDKYYSYAVGALLLDLKNPGKIIAKTKTPIIIPEKTYERGSTEKKDVVFPTGIIEDNNKKDLLIYSGGGDKVISVKKVSLESIFQAMN